MYIGFIMNFSCNMLCWVSPFTKTRRAPDGCQIAPMGASLGVKFNLTITFHGSGFRSIRLKPKPLSSLHPGTVAVGRPTRWARPPGPSSRAPIGDSVPHGRVPAPVLLAPVLDDSMFVLPAPALSDSGSSVATLLPVSVLAWTTSLLQARAWL
jgi:hypothetical protein